MTIGDGIAVAGLWIFVGMFGFSKEISATGIWVAIIIASILTANIV